MVVCWHCVHVAQSFGVLAEAELFYSLVDPNLFAPLFSPFAMIALPQLGEMDVPSIKDNGIATDELSLAATLS